MLFFSNSSSRCVSDSLRRLLFQGLPSAMSFLAAVTCTCVVFKVISIKHVFLDSLSEHLVLVPSNWKQLEASAGENNKVHFLGWTDSVTCSFKVFKVLSLTCFSRYLYLNIFCWLVPFDPCIWKEPYHLQIMCTMPSETKQDIFWSQCILKMYCMLWASSGKRYQYSTLLTQKISYFIHISN